MHNQSAAYDDAARRIAVAIRNMYEVGHRCACQLLLLHGLISPLSTQPRMLLNSCVHLR